jgi:hypothetical protein
MAWNGQKSMASSVEPTGMCLLECLHTNNVMVPVKEGDKLTCESCHETLEVVKVFEPDYEWKLECQDCRYSRYTGKSVALAKLFSSKHDPSHNVRIKKVFEGER